MKPTIDSARDTYKVIEKRDLQLPCRAQGVPRPKISWSKDGEEISPDDFRFSVSHDGRLHISVTRYLFHIYCSKSFCGSVWGTTLAFVSDCFVYSLSQSLNHSLV